MEWGGWSKGVLRIPFAGVWREKIFWEIFASPQLGYLYLLCFFPKEFKRRIFCTPEGETGSVFQHVARRFVIMFLMCHHCSLLDPVSSPSQLGRS